MITNEYTVLVKNGKEIKILPNVKFDEIPAGYTVTAYAVIKNDDKSEVLAILAPGMTTTHIKDAATQDLTKLSIKELKEILRNDGCSFPAKANKTKLLELLGA